MKILHVIPSLSPAHGGPSVVLPLMARALVERGVQVDVATTDDDGPGKRRGDVRCGAPVARQGFRVFYFTKQTEFHKMSLPLLLWLFRNVSAYDTVHVHAVFSFSALAAGWACRLRRVPYVVRPLGVLNAWGMENRRQWLKKWSFRLLDKPVLDHAAAIHYTSHQEADEAARLGIQARSVVIPLGIDVGPLHSPPSPELFLSRFPQTAGRRVVLFLSRLDPKKNVEALLEAFTRLAHGSVLVIAGEGDAGYVATLKARAAVLGIEESVIWAGHVSGADKLSAFAAATLFVLPSRSENFGIALLEAMAAGLPCVTTGEVALAADMRRMDAGCLRLVPVDDPHALAVAMSSLLDHPDEARAMGLCGGRLARAHFSTGAMAAALSELYLECHA